MKEYIAIPLEIVENEGLFSQLLDSSITYVRGLPPKNK